MRPVLLALALSPFATLVQAQHPLRTPLAFEPVVEPSAPTGAFRARAAGYGVVAATGTVHLTLHRAAGEPHTVTLDFGPRASAWRAQDLQPGVSHYLVGRDPSGWRTHVPHFARLQADLGGGVVVELRGAAPTADTGNARHLEYDLHFEPGAELAQVEIVVAGARARPGRDFTLELVLPDGTVLEQAPPVAWQVDRTGTRRPVATRCVVHNERTFGFVAERVDPALPLVVDPVLRYGSFLGGTGTDQVTDVAVDATGNAYLTGMTASTDFPLANPRQGTPASLYDAFVTKVDPTGSQLLFSTFLGGSGGIYDFERGLAIDVDANGRVFVFGATNAVDFPIQNAYQSAPAGGFDAFLCVLDPSGASLVYSTYLGGSDADVVQNSSSNFSYGGAMAVTADGRAVVYGTTLSTDFPTRNAVQPVFGGGFGDTFIAMFEPTGALSWSTYHGGNDYDRSGAGSPFPFDGFGGLTVDDRGVAVVSGLTQSPNFPLAGTPFATDGRGFVSLFSPSGGLVWSTRFPMACAGIDFDASGVYLAGTISGNFPVSPGALQFVYSGASDPSGHGDVVVAKLDPPGSSLLWATYLGQRNVTDIVTDLEVDAAGHPHVLLWIASTAYVVKLNDRGTGECWRHGVAPDDPTCLDLEPTSGSVWAAGATSRSSFVTTPNAFQPNFVGSPGRPDGWVARLDDTFTGVSQVSLGAETYHRGLATVGHVTLNGRAPSGGASVTLSAAPPGLVTVPASVSVPAGSSTVSFPMTIANGAPLQPVTVTASFASTNAQETVTIEPLRAYRLERITALPTDADPTGLGRSGHISANQARDGLWYDGIATVVRFAGEQTFAMDRLGRVTLYSSHLNPIRVFAPPSSFQSVPLGPNHRGAIGRALTRDGLIAGDGYTNPSGLPHAILAEVGGATIDLGTLGGSYSHGRGVNSARVVVGYSFLPSSAVRPRAFHWTQAGGMVDLGTLPGHVAAEAYAINDAGEIVGTSDDGRYRQAFRVRGGTMTGLGTLAGNDSSEGVEVNAHGMVIAEARNWNQSSVTGPRWPFLYTDSQGVRELATMVDPLVLRDDKLYRVAAIDDFGRILGKLENATDNPGGVFLLVPEAVTPYGAGCPTGRNRVPVLTAEHQAVRGQAVILLASDAPGNAPGVLLLGTGRAAFQVLGCELALASIALALPTAVDADGRMRLRVPVPMGARGQMVLQLIVADPGSANGSIAGSNGLELTVR